MHCVGLVLAAAALAAASASAAIAKDVAIELDERLRGDLAHGDQLSGVALWRDFLIACPDEGAELNVLDRDRRRLRTRINLLGKGRDEIDMEAATADEQFVYVVGSHSLHRRKGDDDDEGRVEPHEASFSLFRIALNDEGRARSVERISLRDVIASVEALRPYAHLPSKENGIDVEGLAAADGRLVVGFRGPVLEDGLVPVLSFAFDRAENYDVKYVALDGRGVRDLVAVDDGFLILAGPVGEDGPGFRLSHWNGGDCRPGGPGRVTMVGDLAVRGDVKPEGLAVLEESATAWRLLLVGDGRARMCELTVDKPKLRD